MKSSYTLYVIPTVVALCCMLAGCGHSDDRSVTVIQSGDHISVTRSLELGDLAHGNLHLKGSVVTIHTNDAPDAIITAEGDLRIGQQAVPTDDGARKLLEQYYDSAAMIPADGIATGKAGAEVGEQALKSVAKRLLSGNPDQIQQDVDAKAKLVKIAAMKICQDLGDIKTAQDQLATQLPAFKPYGNVIGAHDVSDCTKGTSEDASL